MRISWDQYFMEIVDATAKRASCDRGKSAAVIVKDKRVIACGYVGAPSGLPSCDEVGHEMVTRYEESAGLHKNRLPLQAQDFSHHCCRTFHGEANAIINCARNGVSTVGSTIYCTMTPCVNCAMMIIQAGIIKVIAKNRYQKDIKSRDMFAKVGVELIVLSEDLLY